MVHLAQYYLDNQQSKPSTHTHRALLSNHFQLQLRSQLQFMDQLINYYDYQQKIQEIQPQPCKMIREC